MAIISLVTALLFIPVVSIVLGHLARREVRKSNGTITGAGMALAGLIIGYIQVAVLMLIIIVLRIKYKIKQYQNIFKKLQVQQRRDYLILIKVIVKL